MQHSCTPERVSIENSELEVEERRHQEDRPVLRSRACSFLPWSIKGYKGHQASEISDLHQARAMDHYLDKWRWSLGPPLVVGNRGPPQQAG